MAYAEAVRAAGLPQAGEPAVAAARVGARWVLEGTVRLAGASLRIGVRLVDTHTGAHLWAETYDRALARDSLFAVQDDVTARIVATVADSTGVLVRAMAAPLIGRSVQDLTLQAPWSWQGMICGLLGAACARAGDRARADALLSEMGDQPRPVWGRVVYHLHLGELDDAATWFGRMIEERDPFALVYANAPLTRQLHTHPAWPALRGAMRLPG